MIDATQTHNQTYSNGSVSPQTQTNKMIRALSIYLFSNEFHFEWHFSAYEKYWKDHWPTITQKKTHKKEWRIKKKMRHDAEIVFHTDICMLVVVSIFWLFFYSLLHSVCSVWVQTEQYHFPDFIRRDDILFAIWFFSLSLFLRIWCSIPKFMECQLLK